MLAIRLTPDQVEAELAQVEMFLSHLKSLNRELGSRSSCPNGSGAAHVSTPGWKCYIYFIEQEIIKQK